MDNVSPEPHLRLVRRPGRRRRLRRLRLRRRGQPDLPRRHGHRARRVRGRRPPASRPTCWRAWAPRCGWARARPRPCPTTSTWWSPRPAGRRARPLLAQAAARGVPVWGEVELAWRLRDPEHPAPWLAVTGTNGKTTTVQMLEAMLRAAGLRTVAAGNVGLPLVEAVMDPEPYDVLAVELSSFQLHYTSSRGRASRPPCSTSPRTTSTGTPTWPPTPPTRAGSTSGCSGPASTTSPTR